MREHSLNEAKKHEAEGPIVKSIFRGTLLLFAFILAALIITGLFNYKLGFQMALVGVSFGPSETTAISKLNTKNKHALLTTKQI